MLTIKAEGMAGMDLRDDLMPAMLDLARRTGCKVEVRANDTDFWVRPDDSAKALFEAYNRLYPKSSIVASGISFPVERKKA